MKTKKINQVVDSLENKIVLYTDKRGNVELRADVEKETLWATLDQIAQLFARDKSVISRHLRNIFNEAELDGNSVVAKNATTATDGRVYIVRYYNLDAILSVGYRVNSKQATQFRIWATSVLRDYIIKGYKFNQYKLGKSQESLDGLREAVSLLGSKEHRGALKGKLTLKLTKDLIP